MAKTIKFLSYLLIVVVLYSCSSSKYHGVMGSKGRASKGFAKRHQSREYQEAKAKEQKEEENNKPILVKEENKISETNQLAEVSTPVVTEQPARQNPDQAKPVIGNDNMDGQNMETMVTASTTNTEQNIAQYQIDPAFGLNKQTGSPLVSVTGQNSDAYNIISSKENRNLNTGAQKNRPSTAKAAVTNAKINQSQEKDSKNRWVLYFALAQAFLALMLGFKQVFGMLDTPSDAGNKAISMSYATIGILGIHTLLLIALAKSFFS